MTQAQYNQEGTYKKIQNYIFNFNDLLGKGNFSKVYKAHNEVTKQVVAIKIVELNSLKSKKLEQLLFSEIEILKKLNHPNVVKCFQVFTSNRNCYIITQLCNQGDLETKFKNKKGLKQYQAEKYIFDIYKGLIYLANNNIVHRDLKVANIFILNGVAKIADFGFAKITKFKFKDINIGSPIYMSPEGLIENIYGPKTDIWAFGMLIYELLHGETPFSHCKSESQLKYNMSIPIGWSKLKSELSSQIKQVILKCLQVDENKRISAFQLQNLQFFKKKISSSPSKIMLAKDRSGTNLSYQFKGKQSFNKNKLQETNRSLGNFTQDNFKQRIKTEIQFNNPSKRTARQYSGINPGRNQFIRDSVSPAIRNVKQPVSYIKIAPQEQKSLKLYQQSVEKYKTHDLSSPLLHPTSRTTMQTLKQPSYRENIILSAPVTFKECVNILHYCRLIFKHLILMKQIHFGDDNQISIYKRWLSAILKVLIKEIEQKRIICQAQNSQGRHKKLQEVTNQYIKKYTKELNLDLNKVRLEQSLIMNYQKINSYFISIYQMIDQSIQKQTNNKHLIHLGHSVIIICYSTKVMKNCYAEKKYKNVEKLKDVQAFLMSNKMELDVSSYQWYKKKYFSDNSS